MYPLIYWQLWLEYFDTEENLKNKSKNLFFYAH